MNSAPPRVLLVDDEPHILKTMKICFDDLGFETRECLSSTEALEIVRREPFDLAFIDLKMTPVDGIEILEEIKHFFPDTTVVIITAHGSIKSAVEAVKKGADQYLQKPFDFLELQLFARKVLDYHRLRQEVSQLRGQVEKLGLPANILTRNPSMIEMIQLAGQVAQSDLAVLIEGESGTGKELIARFIYEKSERRGKPYVRVNCAALSENLLESELFGHVKGAFTGAVKDRQGRFEIAAGGTVFLDEIAELTPPVQAKLLRVLQQGEYERLGESVTRTVDVRFIAATNKNLEEAIREGTFREDLYYRLNAVRIRLLPLRERPEDILLLADHFIEKYAEGDPPRLSPEAAKLLRLYRWSGNVRELEHVIQRAVLLARNGKIEIANFPEEVRAAREEHVLLSSLEEVEKQHIKKVLHLAADLREAAQILGIDPATLWRKRKKYQL